MNPCPHCGKPLSLPLDAKENMIQYGNRVTTVTLCCGKAVSARPVVSFTVVKYEGIERRDDWGRIIK